MSECSRSVVPFPGKSADALEEILRRGARELLAQAVEAEVAAHIDARRVVVDESGRRLVVRNGYLPERTIQTDIFPSQTC